MRDSGTYIGAVLQPRVRAGEFFGVSRRRPLQNGEFSGIVMVAVPPNVFTDFYAQLARDTGGGGFSLARSDGTILARYPAPPQGSQSFRARERLHAQRPQQSRRRYCHRRQFY